MSIRQNQLHYEKRKHAHGDVMSPRAGRNMP